MASHLLFLFLLLLSLLSPGKPDISSDKTALLALRSAVAPSLQWPAAQSPCSWPGVACDSAGVTALHLPGSRLVGPIPSGIVGNLTHLRTLSLRFNGLTGNLPSDLSICTDLRNVNLQGNQFSGEIPPSIFALRNLIRLNLAGNDFNGRISPAFNNLTRLATLFLEMNRFDGPVPDLKLPNLRQFNVSFNRLNGSVPAGLRAMPANAFSGNSLCGGPLGACSGEESPPPAPALGPTSPPARGADVGRTDEKKKKKKKLSGGAIAGIVIGSVVGFLVILLILLVVCRRSNGRKARSVDIATVKPPVSELEERAEKRVVGDGENGGFSTAAAVMKGGDVAAGNGTKKLVFFGNGGGRVFDLEDLLRASAEVLGKGTFGTAYKAVLEIGIVVAVKRLKDVVISEREFREKIEAVGSMMDHENLVPLRAYYYSKDEKLLVYDYLSMGSLSALLHGNRGGGRTPLNWEIRSGIALGAARGIEYLHRQGPSVSHGNIKSSNILLTKTYGARVSDFGLAHLVGPSSTPNRVGGYRAPEVTDARKVSQKADVYSFGVLLLELLTGKAPAHALLNEEGIDLPRWVQSVVRDEWTSEVFDLELLRYQTVEEEMVQLLQLAVDCADQYPDKRPPMSEVVRRIEELRSTLRQEQEQNHHSINDADDGSSRQTDSVDGSGQPPPSSHLD